MRTDSYGLSPIQQGMLYHWLRDRHSGADIEQIVVDLHEPVDVARLSDAWQHAVNTFPPLRTTFHWEQADAPVQQVEAWAPVEVSREDLRPLDEAAQAERVDAYLVSDRHMGFDLARAPIMRVMLFQVADAHYKMVWTFHHILMDGRVFEMILNTVFGRYDGNPDVPYTARPYRDYIDWIAKQDPSHAKAFWRQRLSGFLAPTPLPRADHHRERSTRYGQHMVMLPAEVTAQLSTLAQRQHLSLNSIVMSAWAYLLARYNGESDIVFGATKTTRGGTIEGAGAITGLFLATVPVRVRIDPMLPIVEWLQDVRKEWIDIRNHEHIPLVDIKSESEVPASSALFDSLVVYENFRLNNKLRAQGGPWSNRYVRVYEQTNFPLTFKVYGGDVLTLKLDFDDRLYTAETADRLLGQLVQVLTAWSNDSTAPLWTTPFLAPQEHDKVTSLWNATATEYARETSLGTLIEQQVDRTPDRIAVRSGETALTYRELNRRANVLAHALIAKGVRPNDFVGVCVHRSAEMVIALLAVVKAGAAYVSLDPGFPPDRLSFMAEDAALSVLITEPELHGAVADYTGDVLDLTESLWSNGDETNPTVAVAPDDLAYAIYTSGSTGKPKGVEISRGAFVNFLHAMCDKPGLSADDVLVAVTTISFDIAGLELFLPLITGAQLVLASREVASDGVALKTLLESSGATIMQATPVTWRLLFEAGWEGGTQFTALCGGEAFPPDLIAPLLNACGTVWNMYGPTETTVWSSMYRVTKPIDPVPVGRPIANTSFYILDEHLTPLPVGAIGELYIGGDGVAAGYRNRPDLTAEKFVADPFRPGHRMYRTGDLARYQPDGTTELLGRADQQVKIRGFRIELGEIESVLKTHPSVRETVVVAREDTPGEKRLVAYIVAQVAEVDANTDAATSSVDGLDLRTYLKTSLPDYMVPAAFVQLDTLPLTANGKIDRKALPVPDQSATAAQQSHTPPRTYVEKQLSEIWEEVFALPRVSVTADFFDLGGHSLLAVKLMAKIAQVFGKQLALNDLFESPTIETLAKHIEDESRTVGAHTLVTIQASGSRPPIYWIPGGAALGLFSLRHVVTRLGTDQPVYGLGSSLPKSLGDIETVEQRAANYLELVRKLQPHGPYCFAGFCAGGQVAYEMAQRLRAAGEDVAFLGLINCWYPNYPTGRLNTLRLRGQRLRYQIRAARSGGLSLLGYIRNKVSDRRAAQAERAKVAAAHQEVREQGFQQGETIQKQVLLDATLAVFHRYQPRPYAGTVSLFVSDDEAVAGVSPRLDPRFAWANSAGAHNVHTFPGGHEAVLEMPYAVDFAETLKGALDTALNAMRNPVHDTERKIDRAVDRSATESRATLGT